MPETEIEPVDKDDSEEQVLGRILSTLDELGPMPFGSLIQELRLFDHPAAANVLVSATNDGLIEVDRESAMVRIKRLGRDVGATIRQDRIVKAAS